ncbi:serine/threonine-protein kinase [Sphingomonas gilva]|uniref:serine/threonine-protein kinase n=1 Tax=Sphingomonas gilva TaxID=2305907 RepID=UPI001FEB5926|nr:serine/threonine-protein kinase [Sphingomonas gilva]
MADFVSGLKIGDKLGNGAFGEVFRGNDPAHGEVAVKVLKREWFHDDATWPDYKAGYLAEAQNLAKATHRNVVQVHHVVEAPDGDSVVICMAFCPGGSLQTPFENGPMTLSAVRKVGTDVLMGLSTMHTRGLIHRDIKPANILLNIKAEAQISDFGLVTDDLVLGYASQAGYSDHIAYEVWNGKGTSAKSDVWALGMTLFRLLHGKVWYEAASATAPESHSRCRSPPTAWTGMPQGTQGCARAQPASPRPSPGQYRRGAARPPRPPSSRPSSQARQPAD